MTTLTDTGSGGAPMSPHAGTVEHGGLRPAELRALGIDPAAVIDFSANVNPLGPSPRVRRALASLDPSRYPDPEAHDLRAALAERDGVGLDQVWVGNGATELIHLAATAFLDSSSAAAVLVPTFGEYEHAARLTGARVVRLPAVPATRWRVALLAEELRDARPTLTFCCNPNNPTGQYVREDELRLLFDAAAPGLFVLDEAYVPFVQRAWSSLPLAESGRALIVRSLTKDLALAGLRLGYAIGAPELIEAIAGRQPSWSVSAAAQAAGLAALGDAEHQRRSLAAIHEGRLILAEGLARLSLRYETPTANFVLAEVGDATAMRRALAHKGFLVRDCTSFGLPRHIRIAVRRPSECWALLTALGEALAEEGRR